MIHMVFKGYGNIGCGVSSWGLQNYVDFCLKVSRFKGHFDIFVNE